MRIVMIKGFSKTGKTTTATALVGELRRRGYSVGTVKDIHYEGFRADRPGTDTYKHMEAGARRVTARGTKETALMTDRQMTIHEILKYYKEDFVVLEGDCGLKCPVIITGRTEEDVAKRMCPEAIAVSGVIAGLAGKRNLTGTADQAEEAGFAVTENGKSAAQKREHREGRGAGCAVSAGGKSDPADKKKDAGRNDGEGNGACDGSTARCCGLPVIDGVTEVRKLADLIEKNTETAKDTLDVELTIDGQDIWMVPFVKETLKNVVIGAVKALDGYEDGKEIVVKVR